MRDQLEGRACLRCRNGPGQHGCGRITIVADAVEQLIVDAVIEAVDTPALAQAVKKQGRGGKREDDADRAAVELIDVEGRMADLANMFAAGEIGRGEWMTARSALEKRQAAAKAKLGSNTDAAALAPFRGKKGVLRKRWPDLSLDERRAVIGAVIEKVVVRSSTTPGVFDPGRVSITWRA
jgi:hypothetical protein